MSLDSNRLKNNSDFRILSESRYACITSTTDICIIEQRAWYWVNNVVVSELVLSEKRGGIN